MRDLKLEFEEHRALFKAELLGHMRKGGRFSLTIDTWPARNYKEYAAVTIHWGPTTWELKSAILDVVHLAEPIHSGEYFAAILLQVTESYGFTQAIFTITCENATPLSDCGI